MVFEVSALSLTYPENTHGDSIVTVNLINYILFPWYHIEIRYAVSISIPESSVSKLNVYPVVVTPVHLLLELISQSPASGVYN